MVCCLRKVIEMNIFLTQGQGFEGLSDTPLLILPISGLHRNRLAPNTEIKENRQTILTIRNNQTKKRDLKNNIL